MSRRLRRWTHKFAGESGYQRIAGDLEVQGNIIGPSMSLIGTAIDKIVAGTTTPVKLVINKCEGAYKAIILQWVAQYNLMNFDHYELQVSEDNTNWYSLKFDGTDWKGVLNADTDIVDAMMVHAPIPFIGTAEAPLGRRLYYRMRQKTILGVASVWSDAVNSTTSTVQTGDYAANSIYANNMRVGEIKARELAFGTDALLVPVYENTDPADLNAHLIDLSQPDCVASSGLLPASGREIVYAPATSIDKTLKEYPHPWSPRLYGQSEAIFAARTNLVVDPEDLTTANWMNTNSTDSIADIFVRNKKLTKLTATAAGAYIRSSVGTLAAGKKSVQGIAKKGTSTYADITLHEWGDDYSYYLLIRVNFSAKTVTANRGTLHDYTWIDDETVWIAGISDSIPGGEDINVMCFPDIWGACTTGHYTYWTAIQVEDAIYPSPYIDKFRWPTQVRPAVSANYAVTMPGKFVFKIKIHPWFVYTSGIYHTVARWYVDATSYFKIQWDFTADKFYIVWRDDGNERILASAAFTTDVNQELILFGAVNLDSGGIGDSRFSVFLENGTQFSEDLAWDNAPDVKASTFSEFQLGHAAATIHADSQISYAKFWTWNGAALGTLNDETDIDRVTANLTSLFSWEGEDYDVGYKPAGKQGAVGLFKATTNLVTDPENLTTANWVNEGAATDALSAYYIDGKRFTLLTAGAADTGVYQILPLYVGATTKGVSCWMHRGTSATSYILVYDTIAAAERLRITVTWATKTVACATGTLRDAIWVSDDLVWVSGVSTAVTVANVHRIYCRPTTAAATAYFTAFQTENSIYPTPYTPTTRAAGVLQYPLALPRKFTAVFWVRPWFNYDTTNTLSFLVWYVAANNVFLIYYVPATDQITIGWIDGGVARYLHGPTLNSAALLNQHIMVAATIDLDGGQTGSMLKVYAGATIGSDKDWGAAPDTKTTDFPTLSVGYDPTTPTGVADSFITDLLILPGTLLSEVQCDAHFNKTRPWYSQSEVASNNKQVRIDRSGIRLHNAQLNITDWRNRQILISNRDGLLARDAGGKIIHDIPNAPILTDMSYGGHLILCTASNYISTFGFSVTDAAVNYNESNLVNIDLSTYLPAGLTNAKGVLLHCQIEMSIAANKVAVGTYASTNLYYSTIYNTDPVTSNPMRYSFIRASVAGVVLVGQSGEIGFAPIVYNGAIPYITYKMKSYWMSMVANNNTYLASTITYLLGVFV